MMTDDDRDELVWEVEIPLFSRRVLGQWSLVLVLTLVVVGLLFGVIFGSQGRWALLPPLLGVFAAVVAGLWALGLLLMAVLFRGRSRVRYTLSRRGVRCDTLDRVVRQVNRLAVSIGPLLGSPQALGAGLLGRAGESEAAHWRGAFRAVYDPGRRTIAFRGGWRTLLWVQCTAENYEAVASAVAAHLARHGTEGRERRASPLRAHLGRTVWAIAASIPLFLAAEAFETTLLMPIFVLLFALAMVWLVNVFGWVVLAGLALQGGEVVVGIAGGRGSLFRLGRLYGQIEGMHFGDLGVLLLAVLGAGLLAWLAVQALRGRWQAALMEGYIDLGG